jgi:hypothetical protein
MPVQIDELTVRADVQDAPSSTSGGAPPATARQGVEQLRAARARIAELEARTRAEEFDD